MFITKFSINPQRRGSRKLLASPQVMHAAVLSGFPPDPIPDGAGRVLWRLDARDAATCTLYIVSPIRPDLTHLVEQAGWPATGTTWMTKEYLPLLDSLTSGQRWAFRLTANPTRQTKLRPGATHSQRYGHVTAAQQQDWLIKRAGRFGFVIGTNADDEDELVISNRLQKTFSRQGKDVTLSTATFDGALTVTDAAALRLALISGIGPAKGYGCGLMTLARI